MLNKIINIYSLKDGKEVQASKAIFIFLSDFGTEGFSEKKTDSEIIQLVHKETIKYWKDPKQTALIKHIIPFFPMSRHSAISFISNRLRRLSENDLFKNNGIRLNYHGDQSNIEQITDHILEKSHQVFYEYKVPDKKYLTPEFSRTRSTFRRSHSLRTGISNHRKNHLQC